MPMAMLPTAVTSSGVGNVIERAPSHTRRTRSYIRAALETGNAGSCAEKKRSRVNILASLLNETEDQTVLACQISAVRPIFQRDAAHPLTVQQPTLAGQNWLLTKTRSGLMSSGSCVLIGNRCI